MTPATHELEPKINVYMFTKLFCNCQTPVLGLGLGVDFTFTWDNNDNDNNNHNHNHNDNNPHLNFLKGTVLGVKE